VPTWKQILLALYYQGSYPYRCRKNSSACLAGRAPVAVLIFHRIADDQANLWTTSTGTFFEAIRWLKPRFDLISLSEAQRRIRAGTNDRPSVSITFDDGYAVNCEHALPLLVRERIPCTYFVCTDPVLRGDCFKHDLLQGNHFAPNTTDQLKTLVQGGIEIGAHTRAHANLGTVHNRVRLVDELVTARDELETALGSSIRYFAFPFGRHENLSVEAFHVAQEAGYEGVCSAYGGYNMPGDDPFHLQRRGVDGPLLRLKNWATVDPRNRRVPRFVYQPGRGESQRLAVGV
jgi:peptidoglycan/xylan/chitin deacetylase (PgdA/CDA1 family)